MKTKKRVVREKVVPTFNEKFLTEVKKTNGRNKGATVPIRLFVELSNLGLLKGDAYGAYLTEAGENYIKKD